MPSVRMLPVRKPGSTAIRLLKLRSVSPAPTSRMPASAISPATSHEAARRAPLPIDVPRVETRAARRSWLARPMQATLLNNSAATIDAASENTTTGMFKPTSRNAGICAVSGTSVASAGAACHAIATPTRPPASDNTTASVNTCDASRVQDAPSAVRTAISRRRPSDRASSRLPTLAHAISSTNPTAASSNSNGCFVSPTSASRSGSAKHSVPPLCSGNACSNQADSALSPT